MPEFSKFQHATADVAELRKALQTSCVSTDCNLHAKQDATISQLVVVGRVATSKTRSLASTCRREFHFHQSKEWLGSWDCELNSSNLT